MMKYHLVVMCLITCITTLQLQPSPSQKQTARTPKKWLLEGGLPSFWDGATVRAVRFRFV